MRHNAYITLGVLLIAGNGTERIVQIGRISIKNIIHSIKTHFTV